MTYRYTQSSSRTVQYWILLAGLIGPQFGVQEARGELVDQARNTPTHFDGAASGVDYVRILGFADGPNDTGVIIQFSGLSAQSGVETTPNIVSLLDFKYMEYDHVGQPVFRIDVPVLNVHSRQIASNRWSITVQRAIPDVFDPHQTRWFGAFTITAERAHHLEEDPTEPSVWEEDFLSGWESRDDGPSSEHSDPWNDDTTGCDNDYGDRSPQGDYDEFSGCEGDDLETDDSGIDGDHCDGDAIAMAKGYRKRAPWATRVINWLPYMAIFFAIHGFRRRRHT